MAGDSADAYSVQAGVVELLEPARAAGVGVDVDHTVAGAGAHTVNGLLDTAVLQQRLAFAALTKADDSLRSSLQMRYSNFYDFLNVRYKGQTVLRRDQVFFFLLGNAADAARIAAGRDGDSHFPAPKKEIACRGAGVVKCAMGMLGYDAIVGISGGLLAY